MVVTLLKTVNCLQNVAYRRHLSATKRKYSATYKSATEHPVNNISYLNQLTNIPPVATTLPDVIRRLAASPTDAQRPACFFMHQNVRRTFSDIDRESDEVASGLTSLGYGVGDRIAIWGPNSYEWLITFFGIAKVGGITVCINPGFKQIELEHCMRHVGAKMLFADHSFGAGHEYYPILEKLISSRKQNSAGHEIQSDNIPALRHTVAMNRMQSKSSPPKHVLQFDDVLKFGQNSRLQKPETSCDDILNLQFTSGTTGFPKAVMQTHRNVINNALDVVPDLVECPKSDNGEIRICTTLPFFHSFAMTAIMISSVVNGYFFAIASSPRHHTPDLLKCIEEERGNNVFAVPTMMFDMLRHEKFDSYDLSSLRGGCTVSGGAPCPPVICDEWMKRTGVRRISSAYGMTELSPAASCGRPCDTREHMCTTIGYPVRNTEMKIADPTTGEPVTLGDVGEICARGYHVMRGYWGDEAKTKETITEDGWLHTGDLGRMRPDGYLTIEGRNKEMIIRGGENVYPAEVENLLLQHPAVKECYVVGVDDERMGEEICAVVKLKTEDDPSTASLNLEEALRKLVRDKIAAFKAPRFYWIVDSNFAFPLTTIGKVQKLKLKQMANERFFKS